MQPSPPPPPHTHTHTRALQPQSGSFLFSPFPLLGFSLVLPSALVTVRFDNNTHWAWFESAPAMFYGGAFDVAVIWGLPPPLLLGVYNVRLLTRTTTLQRGPLEAPIAPVACS